MMEKRTFGSTGVEVSVLGFGGAEIGFQSIADEVVTDLLSAAFTAGLNVVDTAECYAKSEELIGKTVSNRPRDYFLFTKVGHSGPFGSDNWTKEGILKSIDRSLKRLKTDYVDLIQLH